MLKTTPLNAAHRALGARMVDFGGWDMPVNYGSQIEEHHAVRRDAGMFDVSHMLAIDLHGAGARDFLRRALANNVDKLRDPGRALYSCMLNDEGGVIDDLIVYFFTDEWFRLVVNAGRTEKDLAWLDALRHGIGPAPEIQPRRDLAMIAVQGPLARERVWQALPETRAATDAMRSFHGVELDELMLARTGYTGEDGFELMLPATRAEGLWQQLIVCGVQPCGLGARDTLRLEAGMNLWGQEMDEGVSPLDAGLAWTVDLDSARDFVGKAALLVRPQRQQLLGLILVDKGGVLRGHQKVATPAGEGEITSGTFSPSLNRSIALARIPLGVEVGALVQVSVRDRQLAARVVKPPFVRNGRILCPAS
ncbi:MAG: glycine cleavage system aminomethyltransferase GcvT [Betaproteobacteria bacterium]|nr:MAG: glycine cleavage system aminomethyltransferase GcvT [Betaproteobacteria bacterium]